MQIENTDGLWVIFRVAGNQYAINSDSINGISKEPDKVTGVPDSEPYIKGIIKKRDKIITLLDVRTIFGFKSLDKDYNEFCIWLDALIQKHIEWTEDLKRCLETKKIFAVLKDPHSRIPGISYQNSRLKLDSVRALFDRADETCQKLKEEAVRLEKLVRQENSLQKKAELSFQKADQYLQQVLNLLEKAREAYLDSCHRMMVIIKSKGQNREIGLIVDEIVGVGKLGTTFIDSTLDKMEHSNLIRTVASGQEGDELILLLDEKEIFSLGISEAEHKQGKSIL